MFIASLFYEQILNITCQSDYRTAKSYSERPKPLLHSARPKLYGFFAILSSMMLLKCICTNPIVIGDDFNKA